MPLYVGVGESARYSKVESEKKKRIAMDGSPRPLPRDICCGGTSRRLYFHSDGFERSPGTIERVFPP